MPAAVTRGRKTASVNRSRQQLQRERALQLAVQKNTAAASPSLPPGQQLNSPPPKESPGLQLSVEARAPAVTQEMKQKATEVMSTGIHQPAPEETTSAVKELEKQEVEVLVCFIIFLTLKCH